MKILLVDDDPGTLNALKIALHSYGFHALAARSGPAALATVRESVADNDPVRLLITDFRMPRMDGLQLIREAKALLPGLSTVLITGYGNEGLREDAESAGVSDYLEKPFTPDALIRIIDGFAKTRSSAAGNAVSY